MSTTKQEIISAINYVLLTPELSKNDANKILRPLAKKAHAENLDVFLFQYISHIEVNNQQTLLQDRCDHARHIAEKMILGNTALRNEIREHAKDILTSENPDFIGQFWLFFDPNHEAEYLLYNEDGSPSNYAQKTHWHFLTFGPNATVKSIVHFRNLSAKWWQKEVQKNLDETGKIAKDKLPSLLQKAEEFVFVDEYLKARVHHAILHRLNRQKENKKMLETRYYDKDSLRNVKFVDKNISSLKKELEKLNALPEAFSCPAFETIATRQIELTTLNPELAM